MHANTLIGQSLDALDTPQLLIDLDLVDANLARMFRPIHARSVKVRVHFKSLKCASLAKYIQAAGADGFLCAKLNEAEVLIDAGLTDVFVANQVVGPRKLERLAKLAQRAQVLVCVDDPGNIAALGRAARAEGAVIGVLVEVEVGMNRCGVEPGEPALDLARLVVSEQGLRFVGLQGYQGHLQMIADMEERARRCREGLKALIETKQLIEGAGITVDVVTGGGTGTWDLVCSYPGITEVQPGSFVLMDVSYHQIQPGFQCAQSILCTVISRRPDWYVLDAGSKAISQDFGAPAIKQRPQDRVLRLSEEHAKVETTDRSINVGDRVEVISAHCCATMNLHRQCVAVRKGRIEAVWPIESSGRYD